MSASTGTAINREPSAISLTAMLDRLERSEPRGSYVVSCYVKLGPQERSARKYISQLRSRMHDLAPTMSEIASSHKDREALKRDLARILEYCDQPGPLPSGGGLAFFAAERDDLFEIFVLPRVHRFHLVLDRTPFVQPLLELQIEFGTILAAVVDRARARVFEVNAFGAQEVADLTAWSTRGGRFRGERQGARSSVAARARGDRQGGGGIGWGEHTYHNRIRTEKERHYAAVSTCLNEIDQQKSIGGFALFGHSATPSEIIPFLPKTIAHRVVGTGNLNATAVTPPIVYEATLALAVANTEKKTAETVAEFTEAIGRGMAVNGLHDTLTALFRGQARELIVTEDANATGFRCRDSGHLVLTADECLEKDAAEPTPYLIDDVLEEAFRQGLPITFVPKDDASPVDVIAAILRFR